MFELERKPLGAPRRITYTSPGDTLNPSYSPDGRGSPTRLTSLGQPQMYVRPSTGAGQG